MHDPEIRFAAPGLIDWAELFGREAPVELELGFGRARFLVASARARPERNFFGVERSRKWFREGCRRARQDPPANLLLARDEAFDFLARRVPSASLSVLHVYHPDPWPKKRHHKRRLITPEFLAQAARCLIAGGELRISTDHEEYGGIIGSLLAAAEAFEALDWEDAMPNTHFEAKYRAVGRTIYRFRSRRREPA